MRGKHRHVLQEEAARRDCDPVGPTGTTAGNHSGFSANRASATPGGAAESGRRDAAAGGVQRLSARSSRGSPDLRVQTREAPDDAGASSLLRDRKSDQYFAMIGPPQR